MIAGKVFRKFTGAYLKVDKRSEFLRDKEKLGFKVNKMLRTREIKQHRPLCYRLMEL